MQIYMALPIFAIEKKLLCGGKKIEMIRSGGDKRQYDSFAWSGKVKKGPTTFESKFHNQQSK